MLQLPTLVCQSCQTPSQLNQRTCQSCGQSLTPARITYYLDCTETEIIKGRYDHARSNLAQADVEMIALPADQRKQHLLTARAFWLQSLIYYYKAQINEAREELLLALQNISDQPNAAPLLANVLNNLGNVELYLDNPEAAANYYQRSITAAMQAQDHATAAKAMGNLGIVYSNNGHNQAALDLYKQALSQAELSGEPIRLGEIYRLLAGVYAAEGPFHLALTYADKAIALCPQITDQASVCRIRNEVGGVYLFAHDLHRAAANLEEAQEIAQRTGYKLVQIDTLVDLAELARLKGNPDDWLNLASRAFNLMSSATYERSHATVQLIAYYADKADYTHARKYLQTLEEATPKQATIVERFTLLRARAILHAALGEWPEANTSLTAAIDLLRPTNDYYHLAAVQEEYADILLKHAPSHPHLYPRAAALLEAAAATFATIQLTSRRIEVEAKLAQLITHPAFPSTHLDTPTAHPL